MKLKRNAFETGFDFRLHFVTVPTVSCGVYRAEADTVAEPEAVGGTPSSYELDLGGGMSPSYTVSGEKSGCIRLLVVVTVVCIVCLIVGVFIGYVSRPSMPPSDAYPLCPPWTIEDEVQGITDRIVRLMSADSISQFHRYLLQ